MSRIVSRKQKSRYGDGQATQPDSRTTDELKEWPTGYVECVSEGAEDRSRDGQVNLKNMLALIGIGVLKIDIGGKSMKRPSSCGGVK